MHSSKDTDLIKAIRKYADEGIEPFEKALAAGADVNATDKFGFTPLHLAIKNQAAPLVYKLLDVDGIDLNAQTKRGFTPLMTACWKGDVGVVQKLINMKADVDKIDTGGRKIWGVAHDWHQEEILELLKRNDIHYSNGDVLAFPPHPKWRPENRGRTDWTA